MKQAFRNHHLFTGIDSIYCLFAGVVIISCLFTGCNQVSKEYVNQPITVASYYFPNYHTGESRHEATKGANWSKWQLVKAALPRLIFDWFIYEDGPFLNRYLDNVTDYTIDGQKFRYSKPSSKEIPSGGYRIVYQTDSKSNEKNYNNQLIKTNMKTLKVPYVPSLDGLELREVAMRMETDALRQSIDVINWKEFSYKPVVVFDIARGDKELYLHYFVRGLSLRAMAGEDGKFVHTDSCVEFFVRQDDNLNYTNFEFNCIGTCLAARGEGRRNRIPFTSEEYKKIRRYATVQSPPFAEKTGIYDWELTVAIPFDLIGLDASNLPAKIRGNFYKCADETANPHYVTWSPIALPSPDYHCPEYFGEIYF